MENFTRIVSLVCGLLISMTATAFAAPTPPPTQVPEPGTLLLLGIGAAGLVAYKKFKK